MHLKRVSFVLSSTMRQYWLLAAALLLCLPCARAQAAPISAAQAQAVVRHWLARDPLPLGAALSARLAAVTCFGQAAAPQYYAVALSPTGFVIVAGDDRVEPIIAFVPRGVYDPSPKNPLGALVSGDLPQRLAQVAKPAASAAARQAMTRAQQKWAALLNDDGTNNSPLSDRRVDPLLQKQLGSADGQ